MSTNKQAESNPRVGGQAIIEGVMMRGPERISAAVRLPDGGIELKIWDSKTWTRRNKIFSLPIIRGIISLAEALTIGIRTLNWSADIALAAEKGQSERRKSKRDSLSIALSLIIALILAVVVFMLLPYKIASLLNTDKNQPLFHLVAGSTRILLFLAYIKGISLLKDIRRVFEYHGAEHQSIFTYEKGRELTVENARSESRFHPRCGTSFLLIVALVTMALFVLFDSFVVAQWGQYPNVFIRFLVHLPFLPFVAGVSYEFLRLSDKFSKTKIFGILILPGLALQRMTTCPPDDTQREVALVALKAALNGKQSVDQSDVSLDTANTAI